ncbi:hypothetical protein OHA21_25130 [Actinoplanes sp. NBC_00393]|uniref:hypothetical protein n=1 Tax=Actinoplanes sp. NBC_00393 TaxID=2975953 RepID=UPI002E1A4A14
MNQPSQRPGHRPGDEPDSDPLAAGRMLGRRRRVTTRAEPPPEREPLGPGGPLRPERAEVLLGGGHLVDPPDRPAPRFPQSRVPWVVAQIRDALDDWRIGPGSTVITGAARGADILIAEEAYARGAALRLCLAQPPEEFERDSVHLPGTDWTARFRRLLRQALRVEVLSDGPEHQSRANAWMVELATALSPEPYAIVVWDGRPGDGPGGTADLMDRLGYPAGDPRLRVIDPTPDRSTAPPAPR